MKFSKLIKVVAGSTMLAGVLVANAFAAPRVNLIDDNEYSIDNIYSSQSYMFRYNKCQINEIVKNINEELKALNNRMSGIDDDYMELSPGEYLKTCTEKVNKFVQKLESGGYYDLRDALKKSQKLLKELKKQVSIYRKSMN